MSSNKYHINNIGEIKKCTAKPGKCRFASNGEVSKDTIELLHNKEKDINNETYGISLEVAIADLFNVSVSEKYRGRGNDTVTSCLKKFLSSSPDFLKTIKPKNTLLKDKIQLIFCLQTEKG